MGWWVGGWVGGWVLVVLVVVRGVEIDLDGAVGLINQCNSHI